MQFCDQSERNDAYVERSSRLENDELEMNSDEKEKIQGEDKKYLAHVCGKEMRTKEDDLDLRNQMPIERLVFVQSSKLNLMIDQCLEQQKYGLL